MAWDPGVYEHYRDLRARAFEDLLARVSRPGVRTVIDAGCGTGRTTHRLAATFPEAEIVGVDRSATMLARAEAGDRVRFVETDLTRWRPAAPVDVVVSNAVLHWIPHPGNIVRQIAAWVGEPGTLAFQVPANHDAPSHRIVRETAASARWRDRLGAVPMGDHVLDLDAYARILSDARFEVDAWETTYLHRLVGADAVLKWLEGTTLRPYLGALDDTEHQIFLDDLAGPLADAYPDEDGVTWFPFTRRFVVAMRSA